MEAGYQDLAENHYFQESEKVEEEEDLHKTKR